MTQFTVATCNIHKGFNQRVVLYDLRELNADIVLLRCAEGAQLRLCAHFDLFAKGRSEQTRALIEYVKYEIPPDAPVVHRHPRTMAATRAVRARACDDDRRIWRCSAKRYWPFRMAFCCCL